MIICIPVPAYIIFSCFYDPFWERNDIGTGIHMDYNCTIGNILLHSFLLICHPYPFSFHEMIFILVPLIFLRCGAPGRTKNANTRTLRTYACALAQTAPLLSRRLVTRQWRLFEECPFVALYLAILDWKVQIFCWPKGTSLESICVKITETACVCDELCRLLKKKKMDKS